MYAVIQSGGHQYRVQKGDQILVDFIDAKVGDKVNFDKVFMVGEEGSPKIGSPTVTGAVVEGVIKAQERGDKILVFHYRRRKNSKKIRGHRQQLTTVEIASITH